MNEDLLEHIRNNLYSLQVKFTMGGNMLPIAVLRLNVR